AARDRAAHAGPVQRAARRTALAPHAQRLGHPGSRGHADPGCRARGLQDVAGRRLGRVDATVVPAPGPAKRQGEAPATRVAVPRKEPATMDGLFAGPGPKGEPREGTHSALQMLAVAPPRLRF